jgi:hypothetical protein
MIVILLYHRHKLIDLVYERDKYVNKKETNSNDRLTSDCTPKCMSARHESYCTTGNYTTDFLTPKMWKIKLKQHNSYKEVF